MNQWIIILSVLLWASNAFAGTVTIHDAPGLLSNDIVSLERDAIDWPFDVQILVERASSQDAFEDDAHNAVTSPTTMVVAIDPARHKVVTRFGTATGVKQGDFDSISKAGNAHFRAREMRAGIEAIVFRAEASAQSKVAMSVSNEPIVVEHGMNGVTIFWVVALFCCLGGLVLLLIYKRKLDREKFEKALEENRLETAELRSQNVEEMTWRDSVSKSNQTTVSRIPRAPRAPKIVATSGYLAAPSPMVTTNTVNNINAGNSNDGFVEGMLVGELTSDRRPVVVEREIETRDEGGSSSTYDPGSSSDYSSSSDDSGGSGSSWDSGGGSDFGGSDGGGGGSDY